MKLSPWERHRQNVLNAWKQQSFNRDTTIQEQLGKWTFAVILRGEPYIAHVVVSSFDYYERRVHLRHDERPITLLICGQHTTCVPVHIEAVFSLPQSYDPYQLPAAYTPEKRGTMLGKRVVLGQLICQTIEPEEAFAPCAPSTRFAYLAKMKQLRKPAPGRPPSL